MSGTPTLYRNRILQAGAYQRFKGFPPFQSMGLSGLVFAVLLSVGLVYDTAGSPWVMGGIVIGGVLTFLALVMVTKVIAGDEIIVYYHHEIAVLLVAALLLRALSYPILGYLDITLIGIGTFLAFGRVGCFMVGCCHGRPAKWGVQYTEEHADAGFTRCLVGVRLLPVQLLESAAAALIVIVGATLVLSHAQPGEALAWYVVSYGIVRFLLEFLRGDAERPYYLGFSQPQWISAALIGLLVIEELRGEVRFHWWHSVALGLIALTILFATIRRRLDKSQRFQLLHPRHIREVAESLLWLPASAEGGESTGWPRFSKVPIEAPSLLRSPRQRAISLATTSLGIQLSRGSIGSRESHCCHYSLSGNAIAKRNDSVRILADLIAKLGHNSSSYEIIEGSANVFHLIFRSSASDGIRSERNQPDAEIHSNRADEREVRVKERYAV